MSRSTTEEIRLKMTLLTKIEQVWKLSQFECLKRILYILKFLMIKSSIWIHRQVSQKNLNQIFSQITSESPKNDLLENKSKGQQNKNFQYSWLQSVLQVHYIVVTEYCILSIYLPPVLAAHRIHEFFLLTKPQRDENEMRDKMYVLVDGCWPNFSFRFLLPWLN